MGVYLANMVMPKNCIECDYSESNGKTYTWCTMMGINTDGLEQVPNNCPLIEIDDTVWENEKYKLIRNADDVTKLLTVIWAGNYLLEYLDKEEGSSFGATTYWKDKDNDGFSGDIGYLVEGLDSMILYAKDKVNKINGGIIKDK